MRKLLLVPVISLAAGCVTPHVQEGKLKLPPTAGETARKTIEKGMTPKKEILERFGPPDLRLGGEEIPGSNAKDIWVYRETRSSAYGSNVSVLVAGGSTSTSLSEKTIIVVYFDERDLVRDFTVSVPAKE